MRQVGPLRSTRPRIGRLYTDSLKRRGFVGQSGLIPEMVWTPPAKWERGRQRQFSESCHQSVCTAPLSGSRGCVGTLWATGQHCNAMSRRDLKVLFWHGRSPDNRWFRSAALAAWLAWAWSAPDFQHLIRRQKTAEREPALSWIQDQEPPLSIGNWYQGRR